MMRWLALDPLDEKIHAGGAFTVQGVLQVEPVQTGEGVHPGTACSLGDGGQLYQSSVSVLFSVWGLPLTRCSSTGRK